MILGSLNLEKYQIIKISSANFSKKVNLLIKIIYIIDLSKRILQERQQM